MKIRIEGNSVRYRLSQADVRLLAETGRVERSTCFGPLPGQTLRYALCTSPDRQGLGASFEGGCVAICLPQAWALAWPHDERIGFEHREEVAPGIWLSLLIEKDFPCSHKPGGETPSAEEGA
ncbi:MAG TPA: hypothetical protein PK971_08115 [Saprospiraceae bacterium]|nr:hypothetical protein [Saprospiraceae bacterium]HND88278.1 hypothetical protein [Saprospiraceae bacterium]